MNELQTLYVKLSKEEAKQLASLIRAKQGALKACSERSGLSTALLNRAKNRNDILKKSAEAIRERLLVKQLQVA